VGEIIAILVALAVIVLAGAIWGRIICGKICPIGLLQDILFKIPFVKKIRFFKADAYLRYFKYAVLVLWLLASVFVSAEEKSPTGDFAFAIASATLLLAFVVVSIVMRRPFCKYLCPGALLLGVFNVLPFNRYTLKQEACIQCNACSKACKMDIVPYDSLASVECIRCARCIKVCPHKALSR
jgi:polyferredoxin